MPGTTIKIPSELRDRLNAEARREGQTVAQVIEGLLAVRMRADRFGAIRDARDALTAEQQRELDSEREVFETASLEDLS
jgi:hypothetical protein